MENIAPALLDWFYANRRILPFREDPTPYHVWLSEIMLQQTPSRRRCPIRALPRRPAEHPRAGGVRRRKAPQALGGAGLLQPGAQPAKGRPHRL